jgi:hypothetical protein
MSVACPRCCGSGTVYVCTLCWDTKVVSENVAKRYSQHPSDRLTKAEIVFGLKDVVSCGWRIGPSEYAAVQAAIGLLETYGGQGDEKEGQMVSPLSTEELIAVYECDQEHRPYPPALRDRVDEVMKSASASEPDVPPTQTATVGKLRTI